MTRIGERFMFPTAKAMGHPSECGTLNFGLGILDLSAARRYHLFVVSWIHNWLKRHRHPGSRVLHAIGIPMLPLAGVLIVTQLVRERWDLWWRPVVLIVASYVLQWVGHRIEGNDLGEIVLIKKLLGKPYVEVAPRYQTNDE